MWARASRRTRGGGTVGSGGFEPPKLAHLIYSQAQLSTLATARCSARLLSAGRGVGSPSHRWSRRWDSNPQPAVYKTAALPIELRRHAIRMAISRQRKVYGAGREGSTRADIWTFVDRCGETLLNVDQAFPVVASWSCKWYGQGAAIGGRSSWRGRDLRSDQSL